MTIPTLREVIEQVEKLSSADKEQLLAYLQDEAEFEANLLEQALGNALNDDGSINFDELYKRGKTGVDLSNEFSELIDEDGHIGEIDE